MTKKSPMVLLIMDGYGLGPEEPSNAIHIANTPELDRLFAECPNTALSASGEDVGLPEGQIGNSEVGHTNMGAGRVIFQDLPRISNAISDGSFFELPRLKRAMEECRDNGKAIHIMGLLSDGGVHSHDTHVYAVLEMAKRYSMDKNSPVFIHAFLDGRDVSPKSGAGFVRSCVQKTEELNVGRISTVCGRYYIMDRDKRWERVQKGYNAVVNGVGIMESDPVAAVENSYANGITDEFMEPAICDERGLIKDGDTVLFINFRPDRAREITRALTLTLPEDSTLVTANVKVDFICMTQYDESLPFPILFPTESIPDTFGEYVSKLGKTQLRIAETEKYAHVTFFFNGGVESEYEGEDRALIPSPKEFPTYDLIPEMSAVKVTDEAVARIESGKYDVIIMNLANCDMVGHTGIMDAAVKAVETVDTCVGRVVRAVNDCGGTILITADHGNADCMVEQGGGPNTAHTTNLVPLIVSGADVKLRPGRLCDLIPTMLDLMGVEKPVLMTGNSLIEGTN